MDVQTAATLADLRQQLDAARTEADFLRGFANNPDLQSLRNDLDAARADAAMWQQAHAEQGVALADARADVVRLTAEREEWRKINENQSILVMLTEAELARERSRADVLAAEVVGLRAAIDTFDSVGTHPEHCHRESGRWDSGGPCKMCETWCNAEKLRDITDSTNALDPAKFEVKP